MRVKLGEWTIKRKVLLRVYGFRASVVEVDMEVMKQTVGNALGLTPRSPCQD